MSDHMDEDDDVGEYDDDDFEEDEGRGDGEAEEDMPSIVQQLIDTGDLSAEEIALLQTAGRQQQDGGGGKSTLADAMTLNKALREIEGRLTGAGAGKPPLPKGGSVGGGAGGGGGGVSAVGGAKGGAGGDAGARERKGSTGSAGAAGKGAHASGGGGGGSIAKVPQREVREVRRPSAERKTMGGGAPLLVATRASSGGGGGGGGGASVGVGSTWSDWEPRREPQREDASFSNDELYRIRKENIILLSKLERIHRQGGTKPAGGPQKVTAPSFVNRKRQLQSIGAQNMAMLKRLENIKSTVGGGGTGGSGSRARPGPPRKAAAPAKGMVQPEWQS